MTTLAEVCAVLRDVNRARALYTRLLPYADRNIMAGYGILCMPSVNHHLGLLATLRRLELGRSHSAARVEFAKRCARVREASDAVAVGST
jgi:hypothetical protein